MGSEVHSADGSASDEQERGHGQLKSSNGTNETSFTTDRPKSQSFSANPEGSTAQEMLERLKRDVAAAARAQQAAPLAPLAPLLSREEEIETIGRLKRVSGLIDSHSACSEAPTGLLKAGFGTNLGAGTAASSRGYSSRYGARRGSSAAGGSALPGAKAGRRVSTHSMIPPQGADGTMGESDDSGTNSSGLMDMTGGKEGLI